VPVIRTSERLADVALPEWDRLVPDDGFYLSYNWLRFVEGEPTIDARYLLALDGDVLRGALPLYRKRAQPVQRYTAEHFNGLLGVEGDYLLAGAIRGYQSALVLTPDAADSDETLAALLQSAAAVAADEGCTGVVFPFLTTPALLKVAQVATVRAAFDIAEAHFTGCADGLESYCARARGRVRRRIRADRARFSRAGWHVAVRRLDDCWQEAAQLLFNLQLKYGRTERSASQFERTLARQAEMLSPQSVVFTCEDEQGAAGLVVCYRWRSTLYGRLAGFDYPRLRDAREYFNLAYYEPIEYCRTDGTERLHAGVASWQAKGFRGAIMRPLWTAFLPVGTACGKPGLDLMGTGRAHLYELAGHGIAYELPDWTDPEKFAAENPAA
jgi:predicted N-acyltransferase